MQFIPLNHGKLSIVDDGDYEFLMQFNWHLDSNGYAARGNARGQRPCKIYMHRVLANTPKGKQTDHINGRKLDNRRENLRICDHAQNLWNSKVYSDSPFGVCGVRFCNQRKNWTSRITVRGRVIAIGRYKTFEEAVAARRVAEQKHYGEYKRKE